jgi:hypothetical protein
VVASWLMICSSAGRLAFSVHEAHHHGAQARHVVGGQRLEVGEEVGGQRAEALIHGRVPQPLFRAEALRDEVVADAQIARELAHAGAREAVLGELVERRAQHVLVARRGGLGAGRPAASLRDAHGARR